MLWRHRFVSDRWGWELPGGSVDEDEEPADAMMRELEEETGYRAGSVEHLVTFRALPEVADSEHFAFVGRNPVRVGDLPTCVRRHGLSGCRWSRCLDDRCSGDLGC
jgi:8-oxo-dGTP pyrophosphatase MutT (NUDIX family)